MTLTLDQALETSAALEERLASAPDGAVRQDLERRKAAVDFTAFGLFKAAGMGPAMGWASQLAKPLAWGVGLGLPALGVGHALISDAHNQGKDLVHDARNQALLTALGIGGMQAIGGGLSSALAPKFGSDQTLHKLAALLLVDNALEARLAEAEEHQKQAVVMSLFLNRTEGTALLRKLRP